MNLFADLPHARWMYLKAALFLVAGTTSAAALVAQSPHWRTGFLVFVAVWSFCRLYYFAFYVVERYIDPSFRFDGLGSVLLHLLRKTKKPAVESDGRHSS